MSKLATLAARMNRQRRQQLAMMQQAGGTNPTPDPTLQPSSGGGLPPSMPDGMVDQMRENNYQQGLYTPPSLMELLAQLRGGRK